jgi:VanZ family protein
MLLTVRSSEAMSKFKYWIPAIIYMALLFWLSSRPVPEQTRWFPIIAKLKVIHMLEYGILFLLIQFALIRTTTFKTTEIFYLSLMAVILYGLTDEFHQIFVIGRTARLEDVLADGIGGVLAGTIAKLRN